MVRFQLLWITFCVGCLVEVCSVGSGGPPYKPQEVGVSVKDLNSRRYLVYWKVPRNASSKSDSVNVSYTVRFRNLSHCYEQLSDAHYACQLSRPAFDEFQCEVKTNPLIFNAYCDYNVSVLVRSSFGEVESSVVRVVRPRLPTPLPPPNFNVHTTESQELKVTWGHRSGWWNFDVVYIILYHADGKSSNKTVSVTNELHTTLVLEPFKTYWVYLRAVVCDSYRNQILNASSDVIGPVIVSTPAGVPKTAPEIVAHESQKLPDPAFRNVTVHWQEPDQEAWLGEPGYYKVHYGVHRNFSMSNHTVLNVTDTQLNKTVLVQVQSAQNYFVSMTMCNTAGKCSAPGQTYTIKALPTNNKQGEEDQEQPPTLIIIIVVFIIAAVLITIGVLIFYRKTRTRDEEDPPTDLDDLEVQMCPGYQDIDNEERNEYD